MAGRAIPPSRLPVGHWRAVIDAPVAPGACAPPPPPSPLRPVVFQVLTDTAPSLPRMLRGGRGWCRIAAASLLGCRLGA